jgi:hypothetical protein
MIEYKLKVSVIVLSLLVTLTGSIITIEDWERLNIQQKIEFIEKNTELTETEKSVLADMMESNDDPERLEKLFSEKASQLRLDASSATNPIEKIKLKDAAKSFETSLDRLSRLRGYENTMNSLQKKLANNSNSVELKLSTERSINRLLADYEKEKGELKLTLVQGFVALKAAENSARILQENSNALAENKPGPRDLDLFGPVAIALGFLVSVLGGLKLILDYKKAKIDLKLAELKLEETQDS